MLTLHETGETLIDDITPFDGITPEEKKEIEHQAMRDALGNLKDKDNLLTLLYEFDEHVTSESKFAYYCDKIEADLQAKIYQDKGMHHTLDDQKNNVAFDNVNVQQMVKAGAKNAFDIWYECDKPIYEGDNQFSEFMNILKVARDNDLLHLDKVIKEKINLSIEDHLYLTQMITNNIKDLCEDYNIAAAYITNFQDSKYSKGILNIVVLLKSYFDFDKASSKSFCDNFAFKN